MRTKHVVLALASACVFLVLIVALQSFSDSPPPQATSVSQGASRFVGIMVVGGAVLSAWGASLHIRCSDTVIRRYLIAIACLITGWFLIVILKYPATSDLFTSLCWYAFYVPMVFIPTLALLSGIRAASLDARQPFKAAQLAIVCTGAVLCALIFTNNLHQLAFSFDFANPQWSSEYAYGPVYWITAAWIVAQFLAFLVLLFVAARRQLKSALLPLAVLGCLAIIHCVLYAIRADAVVRSNLAMTYAFFVILIMELSLDFGILPSFVRYGEMFRKLPFDLKIINRQGTVAYQTDAAGTLPVEAAQALRGKTAPLQGTMRFSPNEGSGTVCKAYQVPGAIALLTEDISALDALHSELKAQQARLLQQNRVLQSEQAIARLLCQQESESELFSQVERTLASSVARIASAMEALSAHPSLLAGADRAKAWREVRLLVAYCKRKGGLVLEGIDGPKYDGERMRLLVNEVCADLRSAGIECAVMLDGSPSLESGAFDLFYDSLFEVATKAVLLEDPVIIAAAEDAQPRETTFRFALECGGSHTDMLVVAQGLGEALGARRIDHAMQVAGSTLYLTARWQGA